MLGKSFHGQELMKVPGAYEGFCFTSSPSDFSKKSLTVLLAYGSQQGGLRYQPDHPPLIGTILSKPSVFNDTDTLLHETAELCI